MKRTLSSRPTTPSDALSLDFSHEDNSFSDFPAISNQAMSEDFPYSDTTSSKSNPEFGSSVKTRSLLPTICELATPSFDVESSSLPGNHEILSNTNSFTTPYGHHYQQTQHRLDSGQHSIKRVGHNTNLSDTWFSPSSQTRACWTFHPSRSKISACVPGLPCEQCHRIASKLSIRNQPRLKEPLESLAGFLVPRYLNGNFTKANVEKFIAMNATGWGKQSITVGLTWGYQKLLHIELVPLIHPQIEILHHHLAVPSSGVTGQKLVKQNSPPLGILRPDIDDMKYEYRKYIRDIVDGGLFGYLPVAYIDQESDLPERVLTAVCSYYTAASKKGRHMEILLRDAIEMHITVTILERCLVLDEKSHKDVEELLGERFPKISAPRVAQRQIKLAVFMTQTARIRDVLHGWGRLMSKTASPTHLSRNWPTAICVFLMMVLVIDKVIGAAWYFCEASIVHERRDATEERRQFMKLVSVTQTELFERCKEIFHSRYKTREGGKLSFNPVRDGLDAWNGQVPAYRPDAVKELTRDLQSIVRDFETEIRQHDDGSGLNEFTYAGRLACIFLGDLLSH
ncbi:hypothetical protein NA56DRAFT_322715 [Hyaloscypha hepaticicola]|uniref:Uncharacterized protein n=1 Tax=Hyaloscypha hepaticicola TaxID=2082293 RepID=A0A2J6PQ52_9HELO|nr:hypothetical protein NA56DRAFT_322715 [Hyaloscypha hepaticicola]